MNASVDFNRTPSRLDKGKLDYSFAYHTQVSMVFFWVPATPNNMPVV